MLLTSIIEVRDMCYVKGNEPREQHEITHAYVKGICGRVGKCMKYRISHDLLERQRKHEEPSGLRLFLLHMFLHIGENKYFMNCFFAQAHYSTGKVSASFTSTAVSPETTHEAGKLD